MVLTEIKQILPYSNQKQTKPETDFKIRNNEKEFVGQDQVSRGITDFYQEVYSAQPTEQENEDNFYENCPKLSDEQAKYLDSDLDLKELQEALSTCKESLPGPDGIP